MYLCMLLHNISFSDLWKNANSSERILVAMRWGLVPAWFKEADPSKMQFNTSNCRSDTMMEKFCYKVSCIVWGKSVCFLPAMTFVTFGLHMKTGALFKICYQNQDAANATSYFFSEKWHHFKCLTERNINF